MKAQQPPMWQITDEDGLPSMEVYDVFQDRKGYIWFGTELGICRYDGNAFKRFATPTARSKAVTNLKEDNDGRVWFMNFSRQIFYVEDDEVKEFQLSEEVKKRRLLEIVLNLKNNNTYILNLAGIFEFNHTTKRWKQLHKENDLRGIKGFVQDTLGNIIYVDRHSVLWKHSVVDGTLTKLAVSKTKNDSVPKFLSDLWAMGSPGAQGLILQEKRFREIFIKQSEKLENIVLTGLSRDREGNYWLQGFDGAYCFDSKLKRYRGGLHILPGKAVSKIIQDREGNYWITTLRSGVYFMPSKEVLFYNDLNSSLEDIRVNCLAEDEEGNILIGGSNGIVTVFNEKKGIIHRYDIGQKKEIEGLLYDKVRKRAYVSASGFKIFKKGEKNWWRFLSNYNKAPGLPYSVLSDGGIAGSAPKTLAMFGKYHLLTTSSSGSYVIRLDPRPNEITPLTPEFRKNVKYRPPNPKYKGVEYQRYLIHILRLRGGRSRAVWGDTLRNRIWAGCFDGLFYYNKDGIAHEVVDKPNKHGLFALSINQSQDGIIWVGTMEHGLYGIRDTTILYHFNTSNGLESNYCKVVRPDGKKIWVGTDQGIQLINYSLQKPTFELFNRQDGLITNEVRDLLIQGQKVWVATTRGLLVFNKNEMRTNEAYPPIHLTGLAIWDKDIAINENHDHILDYDQNNLKISFKGLAYRSRGKFRYKYRMLGLDSSWTYINSANNFVRYPSLPPGDYEFEVKAVNEDNIESAGFDFIKITINYHYTQTWWFISLMVLVGIVVISSIFLLRIKRLRRESNIKQDLRSSQLSALKVQMNPHFIFNALNSIQEFILLNEKRLANSFLGKFADLMRLTLDMSNEQQVSLSEELKVLRLYLELEAIRFEETFHYTINVEPSIDPEELLIPSMLIQPYVENAVKHGLLHKKHNRGLWIRFFMSPDQEMLCCEVEDNGIGRKKSWELKTKRKTKHKSFAMSATQKRLELLNYGRKNFILISIDDLENTAGESLGTKVHLKIPVASSYS